MQRKNKTHRKETWYFRREKNKNPLAKTITKRSLWRPAGKELIKPVLRTCCFHMHGCTAVASTALWVKCWTESLREVGGPVLCFTAWINIDGVAWSLRRLRVGIDQVLPSTCLIQTKHNSGGIEKRFWRLTPRHCVKLRGFWWFVWPDTAVDRSEPCWEAGFGQHVPRGQPDLCLFARLHRTFADTSSMSLTAPAQIKVKWALEDWDDDVLVNIVSVTPLNPAGGVTSQTTAMHRWIWDLSSRVSVTVHFLT